MKHLFADGAYDRLKLMDKAAYLRIPMIPDSDSETKPDTYSDRIPDAIPRRSRTA